MSLRVQEFVILTLLFLSISVYVMSKINTVKALDITDYAMEVYTDSTYLDTIHFHDDNRCLFNEGQWIKSCDNVWIKVK